MTMDAITIYTDGAASGNPGPGGYGVVLLSGPYRKELSEGFRLTTNNRMELLAVIVGLAALRRDFAASSFLAEAAFWLLWALLSDFTSWGFPL